MVTGWNGRDVREADAEERWDGGAGGVAKKQFDQGTFEQGTRCVEVNFRAA